jgi:hypothetical protein
MVFLSHLDVLHKEGELFYLLPVNREWTLVIIKIGILTFASVGQLSNQERGFATVSCCLYLAGQPLRSKLRTFQPTIEREDHPTLSRQKIKALLEGEGTYDTSRYNSVERKF